MQVEWGILLSICVWCSLSEPSSDIPVPFLPSALSPSPIALQICSSPRFSTTLLPIYVQANLSLVAYGKMVLIKLRDASLITMLDKINRPRRMA
jgi:hypothetical protein